MKQSAILACLALVAPSVAFCDEPPPPPPQQVWIGKGQAGYVASNGNSEGKSANAALDARYLNDPWKHTFHLSGLYGESGSIVAAERWDTAWQSNYAVSPDLFTFGGLRLAHDMFSGFQSQMSVTAGMGYQFVNTNATNFSVQLGAGYRKLRPEVLFKNPNGNGAVIQRTLEPSESGAIATGGLNYSQALTSTTTLTDKLLFESGSTDTLLTNSLALTVNVASNLALSLGYSIQDNTKPPAGLKKLDTVETVNLVYSF
jgi:putative salt-induced outer membrane protein